jgi:hypothetical protein
MTNNHDNFNDELADAVARLPQAEPDSRFVRRVLTATVLTPQLDGSLALAGHRSLRRDALGFGMGLSVGAVTIIVAVLIIAGAYSTSVTAFSDLHTLMLFARY